jgi:hypothetical protein
VAVEKLHFSQNSDNLRDRKCLGKSRKSFVELPGAKFFRSVLRDRVFQQPRLIATVTFKFGDFASRLGSAMVSSRHDPLAETGRAALSYSQD